jgi:hypothetical protein
MLSPSYSLGLQVYTATVTYVVTGLTLTVVYHTPDSVQISDNPLTLSPMRVPSTNTSSLYQWGTQTGQFVYYVDSDADGRYAFTSTFSQHCEAFESCFAFSF